MLALVLLTEVAVVPERASALDPEPVMARELRQLARMNRRLRHRR